MANPETESSTSNTSGDEFQVFLSFRGPDTRCGFTDVLHRDLVDAGIRVFIDNENLRQGEKISGELLQAIDNSKLYIPIFSKKYASSHWCLRELAKMVKNTSNSKEDDGIGKAILPIFYHVKPDDVKLKTRLYTEAISELKQKREDHKKKFSSKEIKAWQRALKEVGGIAGWELKKSQGYMTLIQAVVHNVVVRLRTRRRQVTEHLVGMEDRIAKINKLLDIDSGGVRVIGISGMGGIGKTTLAKIIFNKLSPHFGKNCSFLDDIRENAKTRGLVKLQEQLVSNISNVRRAQTIGNIDDGIDTIGDIIYNKKVLIVLDDVSEGKQIQELIGMKSLSNGTRILVTTRDKDVFKNTSGFKYEILPYEMWGLNYKDALELFSKHAFHESSPPKYYDTLSEGIVSTTGGLPLALVVIGSMLYSHKEKIIWEEKLKKLGKTSHENVLEKLKISYDALGKAEQQIFLDVACYCIGEKTTDLIHVWRDCYDMVTYAIRILSNRYMIKVLDNDIFWMHDQLRDLGRTIVKEENLEYPGKRSRLWDRDEITYELSSIEMKESVRALRLASRDRITVTSEQIKRFPRMRFLWLHDVTFQGDFTGCLSELKWISLRYPYIYPGRAHRNQRLEATDLLHLENVVVVVLSGLDITEDVFESLIKRARKLKVLTLCYNASIHGTRAFPQYSALNKLTISEFLSLKKIDCSIGKLRWLTNLSFESCVKIKKLPNQIGELQNLQHLFLRSCDSLIELPDSILKLESLMTLDVSGTRIARIPDCIDKLSSLVSIKASFTLIEKLPSAISKLTSLQTLNLNHCNRIKDLPELPKSLITLRLTSTSLLTVPNLSCLTNLVELTLSDGSESEARSNKIETCNLQWIGSLSKLSKLQFCFSNVCAPTTELGSLSLKELTLHGIDVPTFRQLPSELTVLELYDTREKQVRFPPLEKETEFVSSSSRESRKRKALRQLEIAHFEAFGSSERLVRLREEPGCNELQGPELIDHWRGAFDFPSSLNMLRKFILWGCPGVQNIQFVSMLESLFVFSVGGCTSLKRLGGLSNLKNLTELTLNQCWSLQVVEGINELEFLHQLKIDRCGSVEGILDPLNSKIPGRCSILITRSGELPDCGRTYDTWESYRVRFFREERESFDFYT